MSLVTFGLWVEGETSTLVPGCSVRTVMLLIGMAEPGVWISAALTWKHEAESEKVAARKKETSDARMDFIVDKLICGHSWQRGYLVCRLTHVCLLRKKRMTGLGSNACFVQI